MTTRRRRTYEPDFKLEAVRLLTEHDITYAEASERLDVPDQVLRNWKTKYEAEGESAFIKNGHGRPEDTEVRRLREENRRLRDECQLLKRAAAAFAREIA